LEIEMMMMVMMEREGSCGGDEDEPRDGFV
jgi:hypothetical protein